jgi:hypothetical protein
LTVSLEFTLQELAQRALDMQNAVNMSGLLHSWYQDCCRLKAILRDIPGYHFTTEKANRHPIMQLWAAKLADLAGFNLVSAAASEVFSGAYEECRHMATRSPDVGPIAIWHDAKQRERTWA